MLESGKPVLPPVRTVVIFLSHFFDADFCICFIASGWISAAMTVPSLPTISAAAIVKLPGPHP